MDVAEAKRLKQLEDENAKLKKLLAEQMLDSAVNRHWNGTRDRLPKGDPFDQRVLMVALAASELAGVAETRARVA